MLARRITFICALLGCLFMTSFLQAGENDIHAEISAGSLKARVGDEVTFSAAESRAGQGCELTGFSWDFNDMDMVQVDSVGRDLVSSSG